MDHLPNQLICEILHRVEKIKDRNSLSITCKRIYNLDNEDRKLMRVGCGLNPANEALLAICTRFQNLEKVEIVYYGWTSALGKQLDDQGLKVLSRNCPSLKDLTLSNCTNITDDGLISLCSCSNLSALKLESMNHVSGTGILSMFINCKKLVSLHLLRCFNLSSIEWLGYVGRLKRLEDLCIIDCTAIREDDLIELGAGWQKLKKLHFEVDRNNYRPRRHLGRPVIDQWQEQRVPCDNLTELSLVNSIIRRKRGLACVLGKCKNWEKVHLDMCVGLRDSDIACLSRESRNLRSLFLRVRSDFSRRRLKLTDESLKALSEHCPKLESIRLAFSDGEFPPSSSFTSNGIINLIQNCPVRELALDHVYACNDAVMEALCGANHLEILQLVGCQNLTDEGLQLVSRFPRLTVLRLTKCLGVTNDGLRPLIGTCKLKLLTVEHCRGISEREIQGAAKTIICRFQNPCDKRRDLATNCSAFGECSSIRFFFQPKLFGYGFLFPF